MACPLYSKREQECLVLSEAATDVDDALEVENPGAEFCFGDGKEYKACPIFRRLAIERAKAF